MLERALMSFCICALLFLFICAVVRGLVWCMEEDRPYTGLTIMFVLMWAIFFFIG